MAGVRIKISGNPAETKTAHMHRAVADHWRRAEEAKAQAQPKPKPAQRRTFAHIRHYGEILK